MIEKTKAEVEARYTIANGYSHDAQVIYGDTDSVMINTNMDNIQDALKIGNEFKKQVNDRYRLLEIDIDNVFRRILLHAKKKYAAIKVEDGTRTSTEIKGLDMKRREYSALSKNVSQYVRHAPRAVALLTHHCTGTSSTRFSRARRPRSLSRTSTSTSPPSGSRSVLARLSSRSSLSIR